VAFAPRLNNVWIFTITSFRDKKGRSSSISKFYYNKCNSSCMFRLHISAIIRPYLSEYMLDLTLSSSPQRYGTTQPRGLHCAISCFRKTMRNNVDTVVVGTSGMTVKCVRQCWLSTFERRQFAELQVQFVVHIQKIHLTLMENVLRDKLRTKFQIYTMSFVMVTLLLVFHVDNIHHRSLSHSVSSNHMGYPEERTFSIPQNNFILSRYTNPV